MFKFVSIFLLAIVTLLTIQNVELVNAKVNSPLCPVNQTYQQCGFICPPICNLNVVCRPTGVCAPSRCECMDGYAKNTNGDCVLRSDCQSSSN